MKNGTILLWDKRKTNKGFKLLISKAIVAVTNMPITHSGVWLQGHLYEQDKKSLFKQGLMVSTNANADVYMEPVEPLSDNQARLMVGYIEKTYGGRGYNTLKLLFMALLAPFKEYFRKVRWMPFDKPWFGEVCSVMPDEAYRYIGIDLFPEEFEGYTAPGDYLECLKLKKVKS